MLDRGDGERECVVCCECSGAPDFRVFVCYLVLSFFLRAWVFLKLDLKVSGNTQHFGLISKFNQ